MIIHIYPSEYSISRGDDVCCRWTAHAFFERPASARHTENGFLIENNPGRRIAVDTMHGKLSEDRKWLTIMNGKSYDATTILLMAMSNINGLKVVDGA